MDATTDRGFLKMVLVMIVQAELELHLTGDLASLLCAIRGKDY
jgi:hypothetical protein